MSPKVIHIPLSGGDRKHQAKQIRRAHGLYEHHAREAAAAREEAAAKLRIAHHHECMAWNALMFAGGPAQPSPTLRAAIDAGFWRLQVQCRHCHRDRYVDLRQVKRPPHTPVHVLEASLFCEPCSAGQRWRRRAHLIGLVRDSPDEPSPPRASRRGPEPA